MPVLGSSLCSAGSEQTKRRSIGFVTANEAGGLRMTMKSIKRDDDMALRGEALWKDLQAVHQLVYQPVEFTELPPRRRFTLWPDRQSAAAKRTAEQANAQQIAALKLLSEGVALRRYGATISLQVKLNLLSGQD
jgi:hypothetical protein